MTTEREVLSFGKITFKEKSPIDFIIYKMNDIFYLKTHDALFELSKTKESGFEEMPYMSIKGKKRKDKETNKKNIEYFIGNEKYFFKGNFENIQESSSSGIKEKIGKKYENRKKNKLERVQKINNLINKINNFNIEINTTYGFIPFIEEAKQLITEKKIKEMNLLFSTILAGDELDLNYIEENDPNIKSLFDLIIKKYKSIYDTDLRRIDKIKVVLNKKNNKNKEFIENIENILKRETKLDNLSCDTQVNFTITQRIIDNLFSCRKKNIS